MAGCATRELVGFSCETMTKGVLLSVGSRALVELVPALATVALAVLEGIAVLVVAATRKPTVLAA